MPSRAGDQGAVLGGEGFDGSPGQRIGSIKMHLQDGFGDGADLLTRVCVGDGHSPRAQRAA